jgi:hypothetical protein
VVTDLAEALGVLILAPIAFDLVDRAVVQPGARTSTPLRYCWYAALVAVPVLFSVLEYRVGVGGVADGVVRYGVRLTEAFLGLLLVELYLAVALGRATAPGGARSPGGSRSGTAVHH